MLKKTIGFMLAFALVMSAVCFPATAGSTAEEIDHVIYLENGDYIEVEFSDSQARTSKSGSTTYTYYNKSGQSQWRAVLRGAFRYDGSTCSATSSVCDVTIYNDAWSMNSKRCWVSENTAYASFVMTEKALGVTVNYETIQMSLTCDKNGNLS